MSENKELSAAEQADIEYRASEAEGVTADESTAAQTKDEAEAAEMRRREEDFGPGAKQDAKLRDAAVHNAGYDDLNVGSRLADQGGNPVPFEEE